MSDDLRARCEALWVQLYGYSHDGFHLTSMEGCEQELTAIMEFIKAERAAEAKLIKQMVEPYCSKEEREDWWNDTPSEMLALIEQRIAQGGSSE